MYANGQGVPQDDAEAYAWIGIAAAQEQSGPEEIRQGLLETMTPSQVERAEVLAREYSEKYVAH